MGLILHGGKLLVRGGKLATSKSCCCEPEEPPEPPYPPAGPCDKCIPGTAPEILYVTFYDVDPCLGPHPNPPPGRPQCDNFSGIEFPVYEFLDISLCRFGGVLNVNCGWLRADVILYNNGTIGGGYTLFEKELDALCVSGAPLPACIGHPTASSWSFWNYLYTGSDSSVWNCSSFDRRLTRTTGTGSVPGAGLPCYFPRITSTMRVRT